MPIVINEFEILADRPSSAQPPPPPTPSPESNLRLRPDEVVRALRVQRDRLRRVRAT